MELFYVIYKLIYKVLFFSIARKNIINILNLPWTT